MSRACGQPRCPSLGPNAACLSHLACHIRLFHHRGILPVALAWFPVGSSPLVSGRFLATGVRSVPLGLSPACPSRLTCGQFISTCFIPFPLAWLPAGSTLHVSGRRLSAAYRSVALGWFSARFISARVRPCPHCSFPAGPSQRAYGRYPAAGFRKLLCNE